MKNIAIGLMVLGLAGAAVAQDAHKGAPEAKPMEAAQPVEAAQPAQVPPAQEVQAGAVKLGQADLAFGEKVASTGMLEVQLGEIAQQKGMATSIKDLGKMMVDDHSKANEKLTGIMQTKGITLKQELIPEHRAELAKLSALSGKEFDAEYKQAMINGHTKAISEFEQHLSAGQDAELKAFATEILPKLKHHLQMSQDAKLE